MASISFHGSDLFHLGMGGAWPGAACVDCHVYYLLYIYPRACVCVCVECVGCVRCVGWCVCMLRCYFGVICAVGVSPYCKQPPCYHPQTTLKPPRARPPTNHPLGGRGGVFHWALRGARPQPALDNSEMAGRRIKENEGRMKEG